MGTATKKCCGCKKRFKTETMISTPIGYFHSKQCRFEYATKKPKELKKKTSERLDKEFKVRKRDYNQNKLSTRKRAAKEVCHEYIRLRDKNELCICCNEPLGEDYEAGHFWESGNFSFIRHHEDNIHGQRKQCNRFKGGDSGFYRENLIKKIGIKRVQWLDNNRSNNNKITVDDYRKIEKYYKEKLMEMK